MHDLLSETDVFEGLLAQFVLALGFDLIVVRGLDAENGFEFGELVLEGVDLGILLLVGERVGVALVLEGLALLLESGAVFAGLGASGVGALGVGVACLAGEEFGDEFIHFNKKIIEYLI